MKFKKTYIIIAFSLIILLPTMSCNKEEENDPSFSQGRTFSSVQNQSGAWGICCIWNGVDNCVSPSVNCFEPIVVSAVSANAYNHLLEAVDGGADDIADYFNGDEWDEIFPDLGIDEGENSVNIEYLEKLQSGQYDMIYQTGSDVTYFLAGQGTVTSSNAEFVLQANTSDL